MHIFFFFYLWLKKLPLMIGFILTRSDALSTIACDALAFDKIELFYNWLIV